MILPDASPRNAVSPSTDTPLAVRSSRETCHRSFGALGSAREYATTDESVAFAPWVKTRTGVPPTSATAGTAPTDPPFRRTFHRIAPVATSTPYTPSLPTAIAVAPATTG